MRILSRYIFRELISSALLGGMLATFVIFLQGPGRKLFELLVRSSATPEMVVKLFLLALPPLLPLTIPFGVLVGILIGLGRMAGDGEITAMRAGGVPSRTVVPPVMVFALLGALLAAAASLWLTPLSVKINYRVQSKLLAQQVTAEIEPRVFDEQFPNMVLYVGNVRSGGNLTVWDRVLMADLTPPEQRPTGTRNVVEGPRITVAQNAIALPEPARNRIQLSLRNVSVHEIARDSETGTHARFPQGDQILEAQPPSDQKDARHGFKDMPTPELWRFAHRASHNTQEYLESNIELQTRLSLPIACLTLAMVGIPLGIVTRKGGRSGAYIIAIALAFFGYYVAFITLTKFANQRTLPVVAAAWLPNAVFALAGLIFLLRLEIPGDKDIIGNVMDAFRRLLDSRKLENRSLPGVSLRPAGGSRLLLFQILDSYMLSSFVFYFLVLLVSFVSMAEVFNFFELLSNIVKNHVALTRVFTFLFFLSPKLIYDTLPLSVLVGVLVTFGILTKNNEVTAFKACGVSLRRLSLPIIMMSGLLSAALFAFDHYYIPTANLKQDAIRNEIKGMPIQTYLRPERKWVFNQDAQRFYFYKYFDQADKIMNGVYVYEMDPVKWELHRMIGAERARWQPSLHAWVFENGWSRDVANVTETNVRRYQATTFPELNETPEYFLKEVKQDKQMNYQQLASYIRDLQQSGFDTIRLQVQFHKKFSVPAFALIMALISIPFGFLVGNRGAMTGIGVSIVIAMAYWGVGQFFDQLGNVNLLPPMIAAWTPDALFALAGTYLLLRMRT